MAWTIDSSWTTTSKHHVLGFVVDSVLARHIWKGFCHELCYEVSLLKLFIDNTFHGRHVHASSRSQEQVVPHQMRGGVLLV